MSAETSVRERPILFSGEMVRALMAGTKTQTRRVVRNPERLNGLMLHGEEGEWCPYGQPGDRLWVRETWAPCNGRSAIYRAEPMFDGMEVFDWSWKPSIHMPRWASRLTLEITDVRVQRVQEISEDDAIAEGIVRQRNSTYDGGGPAMGPNARHAFMRLWDSLNAKRGHGWETNPWVWALSFRVAPNAAPNAASNHPAGGGRG